MATNGKTLMNNPLENAAAVALFARIVKLGSLSRAAEHLGVGRSSVSKQLSALEATLGVRLLQRSTRRLTLTEAGERLLVQADIIANALDEVAVIADDIQGQIKGRLRVTCSSGLGKALLMPLLNGFYTRYPDVEIQLLLEDRFADLIDEQIDVAIRIGHLPNSSLVARRLGEMNWQVCASPKYLALRGTPQSPQDLQGHDCLYYQNQTHAMNDWPFYRDGREERIRVSGPLSINDATALVAAAEQGLGILWLDKNMLVDAIAKGSLVPVLSEFELAQGFPVYALYPARQHLSNKTRVFVDYLLEQLSPYLPTRDRQWL